MAEMRCIALLMQGSGAIRLNHDGHIEYARLDDALPDPVCGLDLSFDQ